MEVSSTYFKFDQIQLSFQMNGHHYLELKDEILLPFEDM